MTVGRVSSFAPSVRMMRNFTQQLQRLETLQGEVSSQRRIQELSDGPADALRGMDLRSDLRRFEQLDRNIDDGLGWVTSTDVALTTVTERLSRLRDLSISASNSPLDDTARDAIAVEMRAIRSELLGVANSTYLGRPIFAGNADPAGGVSYTAAGTYQGDNGGQVLREISPNVTVRVNVSGAETFGRDGVSDPHPGGPTRDLFTIIDDMATQVDNDATGAAAFTNVVAEFGRRNEIISQRHVEIGATNRQIDQAKAQNDLVVLDLQKNRANVEDVDLAEALVEVQAQEVAYQAALGVTARVIQPSLLDFLR